MIIKYISELLFDHECVIVPEFGAFISKECPATLDYANHRFAPPSKEVAFNSQLVADDGVLVAYVVEKEGVAKENATRMIHDFAMRSLAILETEGSLKLEGIGELQRINSKDYALVLDKDVNLLGDAFGLPTFSVQPIYRRETYQELAKKIATEQKAKNTLMSVYEENEEPKPHHVTRHNYKWFRAAAYSMMVAMVMVLLGWGADKSDSKIASWNPFFYASPNEYVARHLDVMMESREVFDVELLPALGFTLPTCKHDADYIQPLDNESLKPVDNRYYYVIGASLKNEKDAKRSLKAMKNQGFDQAVALPRNGKGNVRVAYEVVMGKDAAVKRLEIIKKEYNEAAWLLRKK